MLAKCKSVLGNRPTTVRQLPGTGETSLAVIKFIATTRAGRRPRGRKLDKDAEASDARQSMKSGRLEGDDEEENREE